jgi:predicted small lipoprotein YifL
MRAVMIRTSVAGCALALMALMSSGCGQKGPLKPATATAPAAATSAPAK